MTLPNRFRATTALAALFLAAPAWAEAPILVTSAADSGAGSLRAALEAAAGMAEGAEIVIVAEGDITIAETLRYAGRAPLAIHGSGQTVQSAANVTLLAATEGADLTVSGLNFAGPGGFSITARGDLGTVPGKGIFVDVRDDQTGIVELVLEDVAISGVAGHGIHVSDCALADACGGGGGGAGEGSPAGIVVRLNAVEVSDVGNGRFDADGLRVDERGAGHIEATIVASRFTGVGADGVELDEGQDGDVIVHVTGSSFDANGAYCDPALLSAFLPEVDEAEFADGAMAAADIPGPVTGSPDDGCFEREVDTYESGFVEEYEFAIDVDDGFDIDEAGAGSLHATLIDSEINDNLDEGVDFDEEDAGDIAARFIRTTASGNTDDGFKMSEAGDGGVTGLMLQAMARDNGGVGAVFEEEDGGDVSVTVLMSATSGNDDGETGIEAVQEDAGEGQLTVLGSDITDGIELDGVEPAEG